MRRPELGRVVGEARDLDLALAQEAMPARGVAEPDRRHPAARRHLARQHLAVEQRHDGLQRPHPGHGAAAPFHRFGPGQRLHRGVDDAGQGLGGRAALLLQHGEPELALAGVALLRLVERGEACCLQEALDRLVGRADARAASFLADIGARRRQAIDHQRQPARRRERARVGEGDTRRLQSVADESLEILRGARLHARGNLFAQELEKQFGHLSPRPCSGQGPRPCSRQERLASASRATPRSTPWRGRARAGCSSAAR